MVVESSSSAVGLVEAIGNIVRPPTSNAASSHAAYYKPTAETKSFGTTMESHLQQLKYARSSLVCFVGALSVNHGNARSNKNSEIVSGTYFARCDLFK